MNVQRQSSTNAAEKIKNLLKQGFKATETGFNKGDLEHAISVANTRQGTTITLIAERDKNARYLIIEGNVSMPSSSDFGLCLTIDSQGNITNASNFEGDISQPELVALLEWATFNQQLTNLKRKEYIEVPHDIYQWEITDL